MLPRFCTFCLFLILCEATSKIGLGNGRPSEETSSLKSEIMKFKTSECGGSSSEEQTHNRKNKKHSNRKHEDSGDDDNSDDDDSEEDNNKKNRNNNRERNKHGSNRKEDFYDYNNRNYGVTPGQSDYLNWKPAPDPYQTNWDTQNRNPYNTRNQNYNPYVPSEDGYYNNRPYTPPRTYNNRGSYPYGDEDRYNNNRGNSNRDDQNSNRRNKNKNYDDSDDEDDSSSGGRKEHKRGNNRHGGRNTKNRRNKDGSSEEECVSQCVFNNMNIMEDDGIPSEGSMIKWAQDKLKNERLRQAAVREIRKCFGTLATSDGENSCNFSKSLASCLKLGLDDDSD